MAFIESHQELGAHRKLLALCQLLRIDDARAVGMLHYLWWWALDNAPDGDITSIDDKVLAKVSHWRGSPSSWRGSLRQVGLVDEKDGHLFLHDWWDYAGKFIATREALKEKKRQGGITRMSKLDSDERKHLAEQAANARWHASTMPALAGIRDDENMPALCQQDASSCQLTYPTVPNRTQPNPILPPLAPLKKGGIKNKNGVDPGKVWRQALVSIKDQVSKPNYQTWFNDTQGVGFEDGIFYIFTPSNHVAEYFRKYQTGLVEKILEDVLGAPVKAIFSTRRRDDEPSRIR